MVYEKGLFLFHRDLRIEDNLGIQLAAQQCKKLYAVFIFTPEQVGPSNSYRSKNAVQFMIESLVELRESLDHVGGELIVCYGKTNSVMKSLFESLDIDAVFFNRDYTPYAVQRDSELEELCHKHNIKCETAADYYLHEPDKSVKVYHKFTPYYETAIQIPVQAPEKGRGKNRFQKVGGVEIPYSISLEDAFRKMVGKPNPAILVRGGRTEGIRRLREAVETQRNYLEDRNNLSKETTQLSAYIKFGCVSIREVFYAIKAAFGVKHELIRQLIWRDFFAQLLFVYPETLGHSYNPHFEQIRWKTNHNWLDLWKDGKTGFPIVDACMRQLNQTGYMHNRGRMIVAHFLTKTLLLDWREGEQYFARKLTDYDVASNAGNWSAIVGGGAYAMPYFRIMNPWIQSKEYDRDASYIKTWVAELADVEAKDIHQWNQTYSDPKYKNIHYPKPIIDYQEQKERALALYAKFV